MTKILRLNRAYRRTPMALQLHLELKTDCFGEECRKILQKYAQVQEGITRDFIVPGSMTLHGLHYAIMRGFGWQNSHLHRFSPYEEEYGKMTNGALVKEWTRLVGMYFRFPSEDFEEIYWDDDYEYCKPAMSIRKWLAEKYCGPYLYGGMSEHYLLAQLEVRAFRYRYPQIQQLTTDQSSWDVLLGGQCEELIERIPVCSILRTPADEEDWDRWWKETQMTLRKAEKNFDKAAREYIQMAAEGEKLMEMLSDDSFDEEDVSEESEKLLETFERCGLRAIELCNQYDPEVVPALSALRYAYDFGDGWEVKITCTNAWYEEAGQLSDAFGEKPGKALAAQLLMIAKEEKPVCIARDGMNVMDDVGGVGGFCDFLEKINGNDPEEKEYMLAWARSQGWTGRLPRPGSIL